MIERLLITIMLVALSGAAYYMLRSWHIRRASQGLSPEGQPAVLYFRSDHCLPCQTQAHYLEQAIADFSGRLAVNRIDTDDEPEQAARYGVFTLPTTLVVDELGQVKYVNYGVTAARTLRRQLETIV
jgi:thioredoxin 1